MQRDIEGLTEQEYTAVQRLKTELLRQFGEDTELVLFGSKARGDSHEESDMDILVLLDGEVNSKVKRKIFSTAYQIELDHALVFQIIVSSKKQWDAMKNVLPLAINVEEEGVKV